MMYEFSYLVTTYEGVKPSDKWTREHGFPASVWAPNAKSAADRLSRALNELPEGHELHFVLCRMEGPR